MVDCKNCIFTLLRGCPTGGSHNAACITLYKDRTTCKKEDCEGCRYLKLCKEARINLNKEDGENMKVKPICPVCRTDEFVKRDGGACSHAEQPRGVISSESWICEKCDGHIYTHIDIQNDEVQFMTLRYKKIDPNEVKSETIA